MLHRCDTPLEDMPVEAIAEALRALPGTATVETLLAVQHFVDRIGGIQNAYLAIEMLRDLEEAA